jgi:large conductance mechanosensitive channel
MKNVNVDKFRTVHKSWMVQEFEQFLLRGNVIDLAVAVVIGAAFTAVVNSVVADLITPLLAAIGGQPDFGEMGFTINNSLFKVGAFINALISFLIIALVLFFLVIKPVNYMIQRSRQEPPLDPTTKACPYCLNDVPLAATRCGFCTSELAEAAV